MADRETVLDDSAALKQPRTPEELQQFYPAVEDQENAALLYLKAADLRKRGYDRDLPMIGGEKPLAVPVSPLDRRTKEGLAKELENNADTLTLLHQAADRNGCRYPIDLTRGESTALEHLARLRDLARLLYVQAVVAADDGCAALAVQALLDGTALARSLRREPLLLSQLVRIACWGITLDALEQVLNRIALDGPSLSSLQDALAQADDREAMMRAFQGELCIWLDSEIETPEQWMARAMPGPESVESIGVRMVCGDMEDGGARVMNAQACPGTESIARDGKESNPCRRKATAEMQQQSIDELTQLVAQSVLPYPEFFRRHSVAPARTGTEAFVSRQEMFSMVSSARVRAMVLSARLSAKAAVAQGAVAVERFRADRGKLPETWQDLVPEYVSATLLDPFTDSSPPQYRLTQNGYVTYSVGKNGNYDGSPQGDGVAPQHQLFRVERAAQPLTGDSRTGQGRKKERGMRKSLFYTLFGLGKVLRANRRKLESEGIVLIDEGVPASMTLRGFSGMGRSASWRMKPFAASLVLTKSRIYANSHFSVVLDIPLSDGHMHRIDVTATDRGRLEIAFNAADFLPAKGRIGLRFHTPQARAFLAALQPFLGPGAQAAK